LTNFNKLANKKETTGFTIRSPLLLRDFSSTRGGTVTGHGKFDNGKGKGGKVYGDAYAWVA
jgi:hypothetical protein